MASYTLIKELSYTKVNCIIIQVLCTQELDETNLIYCVLIRTRSVLISANISTDISYSRHTLLLFLDRRFVLGCIIVLVFNSTTADDRVGNAWSRTGAPLESDTAAGFIIALLNKSRVRKIISYAKRRIGNVPEHQLLHSPLRT